MSAKRMETLNSKQLIFINNNSCNNLDMNYLYINVINDYLISYEGENQDLLNKNSNSFDSNYDEGKFINFIINNR